MHMGLYEWTISRISDYSDSAFLVYDNGFVSGCSVYVVDAYTWYVNGAVRPSFYLEPDVVYVSGSGTQTDPYRISR